MTSGLGTRASWPAICVVLGVLAAPAAAAALTPAWQSTTEASPDGAALGDLDGDGRLEIAVVLRGGDYDDPTASTIEPGSLLVLAWDGSVRFELPSPHQVVGFPTFADFDGDSFDELAFCEGAEQGYCHVHDGDGSLLFSVGPLWFPSMTNGGPVAADLDADGYEDLVVTSSAGEVLAARGPDGDPLWERDLYGSHADWPFGHAALADLDGNGTLELAIGGAERGGIYVLDGRTGEDFLIIEDLYAEYENYFHGSGPVLVNVDADPDLELVATMAGYPGSAAVLCFDHDGGLLWRTELPSEDLYYTSPAAADTNGDGQVEVFVQTFSGRLVQLDGVSGVELGSVDLGDESWNSPGFLDVDFDGVMEIVTATRSALVVLDGTLTDIERYDAAAAGMFPPPLVGDTNADGNLDVITGTWFPRQLVSLPLDYTSAFGWTAFGGSARHTGAAPLASPEGFLGNDPAPGIVVVLSAVAAEAAASSGLRAWNLRSARNDLDLAYRTYLRGDPHLGVDRLRQALQHLQSAQGGGYSTDELQHQVAYLGILMFEQYIDRTRAITSTSQPEVLTAEAALAEAQAEYEQGSYAAAIGTADDGAYDLRYFLDHGDYTTANACPSAVGEVYMAWQCRIGEVRDEVQGWLSTYPDSQLLDNADEELRKCVVWGPDLVFDRAYPYCDAADGYLASFAAEDTAPLREALSFAILRNTRLYLDDVTAWFKDVDPAALAAAEAAFALGEQAYSMAAYDDAMQHFIDAYAAARPCSGDSFGWNAEGLSYAGC